MAKKQTAATKKTASETPEPETIRIKLKTPDCLKDDLKALIQSSSLDSGYYSNIECDGVVTIAIYVTKNPGYKGTISSAATAINTKPQPATELAAKKVEPPPPAMLNEGPAIKDPPPPKDPLLP